MNRDADGHKRPGNQVGSARTAAVFDIFGSDLDDEIFDGVFDAGRPTSVQPAQDVAAARRRPNTSATA